LPATLSRIAELDLAEGPSRELIPPGSRQPEESPSRPKRQGPMGRLTSLDAFRGLAILGMLLVNNVALDTSTPAPLTHAAWNGGIHLADLVYPWFLLIVGVAIPLSAAASRARGIPTWKYDLKILCRAVTLVLLGCLLESSQLKRPTFELGVLQ